jgi:HSP20 family protein
MSTYAMPFAPTMPMNGLRKEIDRLFDDVFVGGPNAWKPAVDVRESSDGFVFEFDVPGASPESLDVVMEEGMLVLRGQRASRDVAEGERRLVAERFTGNFERRFRLPKSADVNSITANYAHGVLSVRVAKVAPAQPRRVRITVDGNHQVSAPSSDESTRSE